MKSSHIHYTKNKIVILTLTCLMLPGAFMHACESTDAVTAFVRNNGAHHSVELYNAVFNKFLASMLDFMHKRYEEDGKNLAWFIKDWLKHNKDFLEVAKKSHGPVRNRIHKLHNDLDRFIKLLQKHQQSGVFVILAQLAQNPDLTALIPAEAGWDPTTVMMALQSRCR